MTYLMLGGDPHLGGISPPSPINPMLMVLGPDLSGRATHVDRSSPTV